MVQRAVQALRVALVICCATSLLCGMGLLWGQAQSAATDTVYDLHGTVVDGTTGKPLERALVVSADRRLARLTDSEGRFSVELRVPPGGGAAAGKTYDRMIDDDGPATMLMGGDLALIVSKPGYGQAGGPVLMSIGAGLSAKELKLKLMPTATVSGHVSASGTDVASNVQVMLLRRDVDDSGKYEWGQAGVAMTNSHGDFRFSGQTPGEVTVVATGWKGDPVESQPAHALHREYPKVFYGDEKSLESAEKLHLHYGDAVRADLHMQAATYYPVTIPVLGLPASGGGNDLLSAEIMDELNLNDDNLAYNPRDHAVEGSLPEGSYTVMLFKASEQAEVAVVPITVGGAAVRSKPVTLGPTATIAVRVQTQFSHPDAAAQTTELSAVARPVEAPGVAGRDAPPLLNLTLQPEGIATRGYETPGAYGDAPGFVLQNVQPGRFTVSANSHHGYVASLTSGGVDLTRDPLVVQAGATVGPIEVILRDDSSTVNGTVTTDTEAPARAFVFLLPMDSNGQFEQSMVGPGRQFSMEDVVPGNYRAIALTEAMIPYRDAAAMHKYDGKGVTIKVGPGQTTEVEVPLIVEADGEGDQGVE